MKLPLRRYSRRGLSLIEVLLSLAILIMAMAAIGQLVNTGTTNGNQARAYTRGNRLVQAKMAEIEAGVIPVSEPTEGQFEGDDANWSYSITSTPAGPPNLYNVSVRVTTDLNGRPLEVSLSQLVFDPAQTGSASQAERTTATDSSTDTGTGTGTGMGTGGTSP